MFYLTVNLHSFVFLLLSTQYLMSLVQYCHLFLFFVSIFSSDRSLPGQVDHLVTEFSKCESLNTSVKMPYMFLMKLGQYTKFYSFFPPLHNMQNKIEKITLYFLCKQKKIMWLYWYFHPFINYKEPVSTACLSILLLKFCVLGVNLHFAGFLFRNH